MVMQYIIILVTAWIASVLGSKYGSNRSRTAGSIGYNDSVVYGEYNALLHIRRLKSKKNKKPKHRNNLWPMVAVSIDGSDFSSSDNTVCDAAYETLIETGSTLSAIVSGGSLCEDVCTGVGWGETPDATGETTLDAMLMYGPTRKAGCVGQLRNIKNAIGVARAILKYTTHTIMVGESVQQFAVKMGFQLEDLTSVKSSKTHGNWLKNKCQPNFWQNVENVDDKCEPYTKIEISDKEFEQQEMKSLNKANKYKYKGGDTIALIAIDKYGTMSSGTTTSGLQHKIHGRVGDSPIPGGGSYVIQDVGACGANGNGDIMVRFLPSYKAVIHMANGKTPYEAIQLAMQEIRIVHPNFSGSMICVAADGTSASGTSDTKIPKLYMIRTAEMDQAQIWTCDTGGYCHEI
eukprot:93815_1